jgi:FkbM family methyltransferase
MFERQEYSLKRLRRGPELHALESTLSRPLIIDGGSNIGASIAFFAFTFPRAHIVGIEPDADNFELLRRNTEGMNVELHQAALGSRDGKVRLEDPGEGEWGYRTNPADDGAIPQLSISRLVTEKVAQGYQPFFAKIDIEGAEGDLFQPPVDWVDLFPVMAVELHDWLLPRQGTSRSFLRCVADRDRDFLFLGENAFSIRN